jgi:hypothetical protein
MKTVEFKFDIDQQVKVKKLGVTGLVSTCAISDAGITYYINTARGGEWYAERLLESAEEE